MVSSICISLLTLLLLFIVYQKKLLLKNRTLFVYPMWGIGNRLRVIRKCFTLSKLLHRDLVIVEHHDDGFNSNIKDLCNFNCKYVSAQYFENFIMKISNVVLFKFNNECTLQTTVQAFDPHVHDNICIYACELHVDGIDNEDNSLYNQFRYKIPYKHKSVVDQIVLHKGNIMGVHVRQGNVNDWKRGYYFGDEWKDIDKLQPTSSPHFCCFDDVSKNLSACPSNIQTLDVYIEKMKEYPSHMFFVCSDRTGCYLYLHQMFPGRIIMNELYLETEHIDSNRGFIDFFCLSLCDEIIVTKISSFADEASRINGVPLIEC